MEKSVVTSVIEENCMNPVIVTWDHGILKSEKASELKCELLRSRQNENVTAAITIDHNGKTYISEEDRSSDLYNSFLVLRDKKTNEVTILGTRKFTMSAYVENETEENISTENTETSFKDAMYNLNKAFASKKIKRRTLESEKMNVNTDDLHNKLQNVTPSKTLSLNKQETKQTLSGIYLPESIDNANTIEETYDLSRMVSKEEINSIQYLIDDVLKNQDNLDRDQYTSFLISTAKAVGRMDVRKATALLLSDMLLSFLNEPMRKLRAKEPVVCHQSPLINQKLLNEFCTPSAIGRCRPSSMRDKTLSHMLLFLFMAFGYVVDIAVLKDYLSNMDFKRMAVLARMLGARPVKSGTETTFSLHLPLLPAPVATKFSLKRKK